MNERQIEEVRKIKQEDGEQFAKIWDTLDKWDKVDYIGAKFWEQVERSERDKKID